MNTLELKMPIEEEFFSKKQNDIIRTPGTKPISANSRAKTVGNLYSNGIQSCSKIGGHSYAASHQGINASIPLAQGRNRSFSSNKQYRRALANAFTNLSINDDNSEPQIHGTQYQPTRHKSFTAVGLGNNLEEVSKIFLPQKANTNSIFKSRGIENGNATQRQLQEPFPLEERQWSIPSIRMANHLHEVSTASYTCSDEEDDLLWDEDVIISGLEGLEDIVADDASDGAVEGSIFSSHVVNEKDPYEWLKQVRESENVLAEAASSKFLTNSVKYNRSVERQALQTLNRHNEDWKRHC